MTKINTEALAGLTLGQTTAYIAHYSPELLQAVPRTLGREAIGLGSDLPFVGYDDWHGYELSWLNLKGKPQVALATFKVPFDSPNLVESKSFKLYLNSLNQTQFESVATLTQTLEKDLSHCAGAAVHVTLHSVNDFEAFTASALPGQCLDELDITVDQYDYTPSLLCTKQGEEVVQEQLHSHLLKSNCLITNQPDWASVYIDYQGPALDHESLLRYFISFRSHNEFHEQCVERIFNDIWQLGSFERLVVCARYTRRGGLDINPVRLSPSVQKMGFTLPNLRLTRQ